MKRLSSLLLLALSPLCLAAPPGPLPPAVKPPAKAAPKPAPKPAPSPEITLTLPSGQKITGTQAIAALSQYDQLVAQLRQQNQQLQQEFQEANRRVGVLLDLLATWKPNAAQQPTPAKP